MDISKEEFGDGRLSRGVEMSFSVVDKVGFDGSGEKDEDIIGGMEDVCCMDGAFDKLYYWYGGTNEFSVRESKVLRNRKGEKMSQTFLCFRGGVRDYRGLTIENRKWEQKNETRCECKAKFRVHIDYFVRRWYVSKWTDDHSRELLDES
ncbi:hypothetical protein JHK85_045006 [Glycine max]|nr:hypothetical protein JHK85_045006 [Glycine max]